MERKVILYLAMSLDGFIADKNGGVGWMDLANNGEAFEGDTVLMGMTTYRQITQELSPGAWPYVGMECQVFTHGAPPPDANAVFTSEDPAEAVHRLKARSGRNIWVCGGAQLARRMMALDLIDVYQLTVMPVILGGGVRLFPPEGPALPLRLTRHTVCNGVVELVYVRRDAPPPV